MITKEEVQHIAKLARLELTEKEVEKMQKDLSAILDYFALLKKAPAPEKSVVKGSLSSMRKDEVVSNSEITNKIIEASPNKKDGYIKVKTIL